MTKRHWLVAAAPLLALWAGARVAEAAPTIDTTATQPQALGAATVCDLPIGTRDYQNLTNLQPGTAPPAPPGSNQRDVVNGAPNDEAAGTSALERVEDLMVEEFRPHCIDWSAEPTYSYRSGSNQLRANFVGVNASLFAPLTPHVAIDIGGGLYNVILRGRGAASSPTTRPVILSGSQTAWSAQAGLATRFDAFGGPSGAGVFAGGAGFGRVSFWDVGGHVERHWPNITITLGGGYASANVLGLNTGGAGAAMTFHTDPDTVVGFGAGAWWNSHSTPHVTVVGNPTSGTSTKLTTARSSGAEYPLSLGVEHRFGGRFSLFGGLEYAAGSGATRGDSVGVGVGVRIYGSARQAERALLVPISGTMQVRFVGASPLSPTDAGFDALFSPAFLGR